jgi:hypothetical protein
MRASGAAVLQNPRMARRGALMVLSTVFALAGAVLSAALWAGHITGDMTLAGMCREGSGCDSVLSSDWATIPPGPDGGGVPVAALGLLWFLGLSTWLVVVGLPGEHLEVRGGDIWVNDAIARKPDHVNDSVLKAVFPIEDDGMDIGRAFTAGEGIAVTGRQAEFAADTDSELRLRATVRAEYLHGYDPDWGFAQNRNAHRSGPEAVSDLELSATVELADAAEAVVITLMSDEGDLSFRLTPSAGRCSARKRVSPLPASGVKTSCASISSP